MLRRRSLWMSFGLVAALVFTSTLLAAAQDGNRLLLPVISDGGSHVDADIDEDIDEGIDEQPLEPAAVDAYDVLKWTVQNRIGLGTQWPQSKLDIRFYSGSTLIGKILAGTPLGEGPGWMLFAPNGHRRDINVANAGMAFRTSNNTNGGPVRLLICENGNVGIGSHVCPSNIFQVVQNSATDPKADAWTVYSSRTYKDDIHELTTAEYDAALQSVLDTPVVNFRYKGQDIDAKVKIGVIAEEAPEVILAEGDEKAVSMNEYISLLHAAIKAQQAQIEDLQAQVDALSAGDR